MSIATMTRVWDGSETKGAGLLLLLAIADFADDNGFAWPGIDTLAAKIRMSPRHTKRLIAMLEEIGELAVFHRRRGGNVYIVLVGLTKEQMRKADKRVVAFTGQSLSDKLSLNAEQPELSDISPRISDISPRISDTAVSPDPSTRSVKLDPSRDQPQPSETAEQRLERLRARFGSGPVEGMLLAAESGAGDETSFTVPAAAGGADPYADGPLTVWCELIGRNRERLRSTDVTTWAAELAKVAEHSGADAETLAWALRQWQRAIVVQANAKGRRVQIPGNIAWMAPNQGTLFAHKDDVDRGITALLAPLLEHGQVHGLADISFEETAQESVPAERSEPPERITI